jgi:predicted ATP-dependent serine protease
METLQRGAVRTEAGGEPLPPAFKVFQHNNIVFRRAELSMIAGAPGAGKSSLALAIAVKLAVPTLYFSADTNSKTMAMRTLAMVNGITQSQAEYMLNAEKALATEALSVVSNIFWSFDSTPTLRDIDEEVSAFETQWGTSPTLIVVDNLMDIAMDGYEEFGGMRQAMKELKYLARNTNAAVLILHHTQESVNGYPCKPRSAIQGKVSQVPAMVLTTAQEQVGDDNYLAIAPVKNRYGKASKNGEHYVRLLFHPESMQIADVPNYEVS